MTTGTITTYSAPARSAAIASLAIRAGHALEAWGARMAQVPTRDELERQIAIEREARAGVGNRSGAHAGSYQLRA